MVSTPTSILDALNPVGLAAGFDKNAEILEMLPHFGFGFAEIGTVTPKPQGGNSRPRLFRNAKDQTLFNRMGFNNLGAGVIAERVRVAKPKLPPRFRVGINLGKNKLTPDADAHLDYAKVATAFLDTADFFVINVSSPNTPGLRALQTPEAMKKIIQSVKQELQKTQRSIALWVKLAPEVTGADLTELIQTFEREKIDGIVLTNTLAGTHIYRQETYSGGLSGKVLERTSRERLVEARAQTDLPLISVGGISSQEEGAARLANGANLIEVYSGWVFRGPFFIRRLARHIANSLAP